jgi:hypothetical protein
MFETSREGDPHKLVFFEIFSSSAAHKVSPLNRTT